MQMLSDASVDEPPHRCEEPSHVINQLLDCKASRKQGRECLYLLYHLYSSPSVDLIPCRSSPQNPHYFGKGVTDLIIAEPDADMLEDTPEDTSAASHPVLCTASMSTHPLSPNHTEPLMNEQDQNFYHGSEFAISLASLRIGASQNEDLLQHRLTERRNF